MIAKPTDFSTDPEAYMKLLTIWHNQQTQDQQNAKAHDEYVTDAASWVVNNQQRQDNGLSLMPLPVMPFRLNYNDDGTITKTPFTDLSVPTLRSSVPQPQGITGLVPAGTPQQMTTDQMFRAIMMLLNSLVK